MRPKEYEISGCPTCGNTDPDWSEFQRHMWCPKCEIDFEPEQGGVFDGPIPMNCCRMLGVTFDSYVLATNEIERYDYDKKVWYREPAPAVSE